ncbi:unnamed protein product [Caenorhabditis nigoni]
MSNSLKNLLLGIFLSVNIIIDFRRENFKSGYTIRACQYLLCLAFIVFIPVIFTSGAVTSITTDLNTNQKQYEIGYSPGFCLGSAILSIIVFTISMYLGKGCRCCNQTPPVDAYI